jgi:hypothetical protein
VPGQQRVEVDRRERPGEVEALGDRAAERLQPGHLRERFHALGDRVDPHRLGQVDDGPHDRRVDRVVRDALHKDPVHLHLVHRELLEVGQ